MSTRIDFLRPLDYVLTVADIAGITACIHLTGGVQSPFYYLYGDPALGPGVPFRYHQNPGQRVLSIGFLSRFNLGPPRSVGPRRARRARRPVGFHGDRYCHVAGHGSAPAPEEDDLQQSVRAMDSNVTFLNELNAIALELPLVKLQEQIANRLNQILKPFDTYARLWVYDEGWRTLKGWENIRPAPRVPHFLPVRACPAFALRTPFRFDSHKGEPCHSEQFNYTAHLCLPVYSEKETFGVLSWVPTPSSRGAPRISISSRPWPIHRLTLQRKTCLNACRKRSPNSISL